MKTLKLLYKYLINPKFNFRKPAKKSVIIYDRSGSEILLEYLNIKDVEVLDVRGESLNIYVLLKMILSGKATLEYYLDQYIKCVKPTTVITFIDNSLMFYKIKGKNPLIRTIFVQNGLRGNEIFELLEKKKSNSLQVDYLLTHKKKIGDMYSKYLKGEVIPIGSIKNNFIKNNLTLKNKIKSLLFISQYRSRKIYTDKEGNVLPLNEFFIVEKLLLPMLQEYCMKNKIIFKISANSYGLGTQEHMFYTEILGNDNWEYIPKENIYSSYEEINKTDYIVFAESALGMESIGRRKKTISFYAKSTYINHDSRSFCWENKYPKKGPFWTDEVTISEFDRLIKFLVHTEDEQWEEVYDKYQKEIMEFDEHNSKFINLMKKLNVPLNDKFNQI